MKFATTKRQKQQSIAIVQNVRLSHTSISSVFLFLFGSADAWQRALHADYPDAVYSDEITGNREAKQTSVVAAKEQN